MAASRRNCKSKQATHRRWSVMATETEGEAEASHQALPALEEVEGVTRHNQISRNFRQLVKDAQHSKTRNMVTLAEAEAVLVEPR